MPYGMLSLEETAKYLNLSKDEVKEIARSGEISVYKLGDKYLRFRQDQVVALRKKLIQTSTAPVLIDKSSLIDRLKDFWYFNNFYIISTAIIVILIILILR